MRTWQDPGFVTWVNELSVPQLLDRLLEGVARAEGGNLLGGDLHLLTSLRVPTLPGLTLLDGELPEACDLDLLAGLERFGHYLLEGLEVLLDLALGHPSFLGDPLDEFLLLHGCSFLWSSSASWRAYLGLLLPVIRDSESLAIPSVPADLAERILWGCGAGRTPHFARALQGQEWAAHAPSAQVRVICSTRRRGASAVRPWGVLRTSPVNLSAKFALMEFQEVRPVNRGWGTQGPHQDACRDLLPAPGLYRAPRLPAPVRRSLRCGDRL